MDTAVFLNPITYRVETMPIEMIGAYVPYSNLNLQEVAQVAFIRDEEAAVNLLNSITDTPILSIHPEERKTGLDSIESWYPRSEGTGYDRLSVEFPY